MVTKRPIVQEVFIPMEDDQWWEAVLADEACFPGSAPARAPLVKPSELIPFSKTEKAPRAEKSEKIDWSKAIDLYQQDQVVTLSVVGFNRGGLLVEKPGLQGFVPYSHLLEMKEHREAERESILAGYVGRDMMLKIIECVPEEGRLVFSERAARAGVGCRNRLFTSLKAGQRVPGEVTNVTDFGAFIDLGGVEGLIHISELSWGRVEHPSHILEAGEKIEVMILDVSPERCRVALSLKRLFPNPWETVHNRYAVNDIVPATITSVVSYGAFARLEEGLEGLV
ncbi:MAG: S1 RNA-binding domain-containing protein, partial [Anaerolineales bacterium]